MRREFLGPNTAHPSVVNFDIKLNQCYAGNLEVGLQLDGATDSRPDVLTLNRAGSGVGIQVLNKNDSDTPIVFGSPVPVGSTNGQLTFPIPLAARYFQVGNEVVPGDASGAAQFTVTYQ